MLKKTMILQSNCKANVRRIFYLKKDREIRTVIEKHSIYSAKDLCKGPLELRQLSQSKSLDSPLYLPPGNKQKHCSSLFETQSTYKIVFIKH